MERMNGRLKYVSAKYPVKIVSVFYSFIVAWIRMNEVIIRCWKVVEIISWKVASR